MAVPSIPILGVVLYLVKCQKSAKLSVPSAILMISTTIAPHVSKTATVAGAMRDQIALKDHRMDPKTSTSACPMTGLMVGRIHLAPDVYTR